MFVTLILYPTLLRLISHRIGFLEHEKKRLTVTPEYDILNSCLQNTKAQYIKFGAKFLQLCFLLKNMAGYSYNIGKKTI